MNYENNFIIFDSVELLQASVNATDTLPVFRLLQLQNTYYESLIKIEKNKLYPDFWLNYFLGTNRYQNAQYYQGFEAGIAIPIFFGGQKAKIKASKISYDTQNLLSENKKNLIINKINKLISEQLKYKHLLNNYYLSGKALQNEIMRTSLKTYQVGKIDFYQFINSYETAVKIQIEYIHNVLKYNTLSAELLYFSNN